MSNRSSSGFFSRRPSLLPKFNGRQQRPSFAKHDRYRVGGQANDKQQTKKTHSTAFNSVYLL